MKLNTNDFVRIVNCYEANEIHRDRVFTVAFEVQIPDHYRIEAIDNSDVRDTYGIRHLEKLEKVRIGDLSNGDKFYSDANVYIKTDGTDLNLRLVLEVRTGRIVGMQNNQEVYHNGKMERGK